ncbi:MAG: MFS transporter [Novosphingobium sp.]
MRARPAAIILALFLAEMTVTFESTMIYAALPTLVREFGDPIRAGWLITSHLLIAAATAPIAGRLGDIRGRKHLIMLLLGVALVGSVLSAVTENFLLILLGRAMQGLSAAVLPLSIGVLRESLPEDKVPMGIGLLTTALGAGSAAGLVLGGVIIDHLPWHWLFVASALLLALSMVAVSAFVPSRPGTPTRQPIDWVEGLLPVPAIAAILFGISLTKQEGWQSPQVLGLIAAGVLLLGWWARRSLAAAEPFIDLRLFAQRDFAVANAVSVLLAMGTMQVVYVFSNYVQSPTWTAVGLGMTATMAGLAKLPSNFTSFFAGPFAGWLTRRVGHRSTVLMALAIATVGWLAALAMPDRLLQVIVLLCVISFGTTMMQAAIPTIIVACAPPNRTSEAAGSMSVVRGIASALGAQLIAVMLASDTITAPGGDGAYPSADGYRLTMIWIAGLTAAGLGIGLFLNKRLAPVRAA